MWDPFSEFETAVLPNGLSVHAAHWRSRSFETIGFLVHSGAECDLPKRSGTAHFVEHMINMNGLVPRDAMEAFFDEYGGSVDVGTCSWSVTEYGFSLPADQRALVRGLDLFGSMLMDAKLKKGLAIQRNIIQGEYDREFLVLPALSSEIIAWRRRNMYRGSPIADFVSPLGKPDSVKAMTGDVLQTFYDRWYVPANMSLVALGGLPVSIMLDLISMSPLGDSKPGHRHELPERFSPPMPDDARLCVSMHEHIQGATHGAYGSFVACPVPERRPSIGIACNMVNHLVSEAVRERRGWTYDIHCASTPFLSCYEIGIECPAIGRRGLKYVEKAVDGCIERAWDRPDLFERFKHHRLAGRATLDLAGREVVEWALEDLNEAQRIIPLADTTREIEETTFEDVRAVIERIATHRCTILLTP